jgi:predicted PurR-regulated permease PerM
MWFEAKVFHKSKHKKALSILCTYFISIITVAGLLMAVIPQLGLSISTFIDKLPGKRD